MNSDVVCRNESASKLIAPLLGDLFAFAIAVTTVKRKFFFNVFFYLFNFVIESPYRTHGTHSGHIRNDTRLDHIHQKIY